MGGTRAVASVFCQNRERWQLGSSDFHIEEHTPYRSCSCLSMHEWFLTNCVFYYVCVASVARATIFATQHMCSYLRSLIQRNVRLDIVV